jgi:hypothetical protein
MDVMSEAGTQKPHPALAAFGGGGATAAAAASKSPKPIRPVPAPASSAALTQYRSLIAKLRGPSEDLEEKLFAAYNPAEPNPLIARAYDFFTGVESGVGFNKLFASNGEIVPTVEGLRL